MKQNNNEVKHNGLKDMLANGQILYACTEKYILTANPALDIDRVRVTVVAKGTQGKDHADIYLEVLDDFKILCDEIDTGVAWQKFAADATSQYPSAYTFTKGEKGAKRLQIGGGKSGVRVQLSNGKDFKSCVCPPNKLKTMSFLFKLITGAITYPAGTYWDELYQTYWKNARNRKNQYDESDNDYIPAENEYVQPPQQMQTEPVQQPQMTKTSFTLTSPLTAMNTGDYAATGASADGEIRNLLFPVGVVSSFGQIWGSIVNMSKDMSAPLKIDVSYVDMLYNGKSVAVIQDMTTS